MKLKWTRRQSGAAIIHTARACGLRFEVGMVDDIPDRWTAMAGPEHDKQAAAIVFKHSEADAKAACVEYLKGSVH